MANTVPDASESQESRRREATFVGLAVFSMIVAAVIEHTAGSLSATAIAVYTLSYLAGGYDGALTALKSLRKGDIDIDLLMILAALGAAAIGAPFEGAMLLSLFSLSNLLQSFALGHSRSAIAALSKLRPQTARLKIGDDYKDVPLGKVAVGDVLIIRPGEQIPLDAEVSEGYSSVDQSSITGESIPVNKELGNVLFAGTQNLNGSLQARVTRLSSDSTLARMIALVEDAQAQKAQTQRFLETAERRYAAGVILFTILVAVLPPLLFSHDWFTSIYRAITVMVVASPCALVISTPASILAAIANGARHGILFKGGVPLEYAARVKAVAFDKTGTLTTGRPIVQDVWHAPDALDQETLLRIAASIEARSEHPLADAIVRYAKEQSIRLVESVNIRADIGSGLHGNIGDDDYAIGSRKWIETHYGWSDQATPKADQWAKNGYTVIALSKKKSATGPGTLLGLFAIADSVRQEAAKAVNKLRENGIQDITMLTGDSEEVARSIGDQLNLTETHANLLPEGKVEQLRRIELKQPTAMIGDGINDAPALASASLGVAMGGAGNDIAMQSADIVLMSNDLNQVPYLFKLSQATRRIVWQNLIFAGSIIAVMVITTLALPLISPQRELPLTLGVLAHEGGTVLVCLNGLRLLFLKPD